MVAGMFALHLTCDRFPCDTTRTVCTDDQISGQQSAISQHGHWHFLLLINVDRHYLSVESDRCPCANCQIVQHGVEIGILNKIFQKFMNTQLRDETHMKQKELATSLFDDILLPFE